MTPVARLAYRPELDAIRGVAVLLVLVQHFGLLGRDGGRAGQIGVTLFFVLSGYLITGLLLAERRRSGTVSLRRFYVRRARRLWPALIFVVAVAWAFGLPGNPLVALTYTSNIYIDLGGDLGAYTHTWTLAMEEQFYLVWPAAFLLLSRWRRALPVVVIAALALFALMPGMYLPRNISLLAGVLLALRPSRIPRWAGAIGWVGVLLLGLTAGATDGVTIAAATLAAVLVVAVPGPIAWRPLVYIGTISYAVYLWSYPIAVLVPTSTVYWGPTLFGLGLTITMAMVSARFVERRWRLRQDVPVLDSGSPVQGTGRARLGDDGTEPDLGSGHRDPEGYRQREPLASSR